MVICFGQDGRDDGEERLAPAEGEISVLSELAQRARFASGDGDGVALKAFPSACELVGGKEAEIRRDGL